MDPRDIPPYPLPAGLPLPYWASCSECLADTWKCVLGSISFSSALKHGPFTSCSRRLGTQSWHVYRKRRALCFANNLGFLFMFLSLYADVSMCCRINPGTGISVDIFGRSKQFSYNGFRKSNMGRASYVWTEKTLFNRIRRLRSGGRKEGTRANIMLSNTKYWWMWWKIEE